MVAKVERLIFAWWNTGISPVAARGRASKEDLETAKGIVSTLFRDSRVDFLGLGEVTRADLDLLAGAVPECSIYDGTLREGRAQFDTGALFNAERFRILDDTATFQPHGTRMLKLANRIDLTVAGDSHPFHVFLSHWPSHIVPDSETIRITLGARLRSLLDELITEYNGDTRLIIMGDFNEEPFHECLENQLHASRDRKLVTKSSSYLYNPFWRHLGESQPYSQRLARKSFAGTCFIGSGNATRWKTVDQIMLSSAFLGRCPWHLNEELTKILYLTPRAVQGDAVGGIFDHFPVIATIEKTTFEEGATHD
ncbi:MAG: endonuclease/exonuclease/phosphatase family protein [Planctomycetota bacterium]